VVDRSDAEELMAQVRTRLGLHDSERRFPAGAHLPGHAVAHASTASSRWPRCWPRTTPGAPNGRPTWPPVRAYTEAKQAQRVLDYDDLLLYWQLALQEGAVAQAMGGRFDHVLVDEFQDTNRCRPASCTR
jgi:DNA helicase-2/ATP-dependent DNA helicase PcrA